MRCPRCGEIFNQSRMLCPECGLNLSFSGRDITAAAASSSSSVSRFSGTYDNSWAVVIGINDYKTTASLDFAVSDAELVCSTLYCAGFKKDNVIRLFNRRATRQNIRDVINVELARRTGINDRVLIFFAGHGQDFTTPGGRKMGYLFPVDGDPEYLASRCISMDEINLWSEYIPAKHVLYVMDCCYSGLAAVRSCRTDVERRDYMDVVMRRPVRQIITAGRADQRVFEDSGHGIFTRIFVRGIKGGADLKGRGFVTGFDLGHYLESRVYEESGGRQQPLFRYLGGDGEFVFTHSRKQSGDVRDRKSFASFSGRFPKRTDGSEGFLQRESMRLLSKLRNGTGFYEELERLAGTKMERLHSLSARGDVRAGWMLGCCFALGCGVKQDFVRAFEFFSCGSDSYGPSAYFMGLCFAYGLGAEKDGRKARDSFRRAARKRMPEAYLALGLSALKSDAASGQRSAAALFRCGAREGSLQSQYNYALCFIKGIGAGVNPERGFRLMLECAGAGYSHAQFNTALCYARGIGTGSDPALAKYWMTRFIESRYRKKSCGYGHTAGAFF